MKTMLDYLEIKSTVIIRKLSKKEKIPQKVITIRGKIRLKKWMDMVGFNNPVSKTKVRIWERFGYCPSYTSLKQRKRILKGLLDPVSFYEK